MKKVIFLCALCLCALVVTGCNKQDQAATVLGTWKLTSYTDGTVFNDDPNSAPNYYLLLVNDTVWEWQYEQPANVFQTAYSGTYTLENDVVIFTQTAVAEKGKFTITQLTADELILQDASETGYDHGITGTPWADVNFIK